jgi:hypothetical protein
MVSKIKVGHNDNGYFIDEVLKAQHERNYMTDDSYGRYPHAYDGLNLRDARVIAGALAKLYRVKIDISDLKIRKSEENNEPDNQK